MNGDFELVSHGEYFAKIRSKKTGMSIQLQREFTDTSTRKVFVDKLRTFVLKVDKDDEAGRSMDQCSKEVQFWKNLPENLREYFAPILSFGDGWVLQKYMIVVPPDEHEKGDNWLYIEEKFGVHDMDKSNYGYDPVTSKPIILDYGVY